MRGLGFALALLALTGGAAGARECPPLATAPLAEVKTQAPGQRVTVEGVVTGVFLGREALGGFYLQQAGAPEPAAVFVFAPRLGARERRGIEPGVRVRLAAETAEHRGRFQLSAPARVEVCGRPGLPDPVPLELPADADRLARLVDVKVRFDQPLTVTGNYLLARYGSLDLAAGGRLFRPTNAPDGDPAANARRRIVLDDGSYRAQPEPIPYLDAYGSRRSGAVIEGLTGILAHAFEEYRVHPIRAVHFDDANPRPAAPPPVPGRVRAAAFNVENYFLSLGQRGARHAQELERQRAKLLAAAHGLEADLLALVEVENRAEALTDLVRQLNRGAEEAHWRAVPVPQPLGTDAIQVALVYRADRLEVVGAPRVDTDPIHERPPVAAVFRARAGGAPFLAVAVHFKSKTGCPARGDIDRGQGCWNQRRTAQGEALAGFVRRAAHEAAVEDVLVLGDLNAYGAEDPLRVLDEAGLVDLVAARLPPERRYTYVFRGEAGYLDHVLASAGMAERVRGVAIWHINADEPPHLAFDGRRDWYAPDPYRSSDHDPVLVGFD
ncbi:ExeM/NucH family extracellular endonuclease [Ectothiorhodospiraceae bacterium 2226]|nr:ExeM/NucH family extracellular endonuclease [Ectothiorhodospiraceae bacterium 2226]